VLDFDSAGKVIGIEIEHASQRINLRDLHVTEIPPGVSAAHA
jgi:uncharacterized protein YuzE